MARKRRILKSTPHAILFHVYRRLLEQCGPQGWWPGESREEIIIGAVLTQNTNWGNVERAIANLKAANSLCLRTIAQLKDEELAQLIRPSGYFRLKAERLKSTARFFTALTPDVENFHIPAPKRFRAELLQVKGVGEETADSILLYAFGIPEFVVDAYTRRFGARHGFFEKLASYDTIKAFFTEHLPRKAALFNEYHALLVRLGKLYCRRTPHCAPCPLNLKRLFIKERSGAH